MNAQRILHFVLPIFCLTTAAVSPTAAQQPASVQHGVLFLPPDFYHKHREALGISEDQLREMQRIAEESFKPAGDLQAEMRKRTEALHEAIARHPADPDEAAQRLRQVLEIEDQLKSMQLRAKVAMRNVLSPDQFEGLKRLVAKMQGERGGGVTAGLKEKFERLKQEIKHRTGGGEPPRAMIDRLERIESAARDGRVEEAERQVDALARQLEGGEESGQADAGGISQRLQRMEEALRNTTDPGQRERIQQQMRQLREQQGSDRSDGGAGRSGGERGGIQQQLQRLEEALKDTDDPARREQIQQQMRRLRESQGMGKGPEGGRARGGQELEQQIRRVAETAERTDNPEVREKLQGAVAKLREAAAAGNQAVVDDIFRAIKPLLEGQRQGP
jgi:Spy/CpxP family protein refolding chaperone